MQAQLKQKGVKNGNFIKIMHVNTKHFLHSHNIKYATGSHQQEVTCFNNINDANNCWEIISEHKKIHNEAIIRLKHRETGHYLHSHNTQKSPSSHQQEVTCFWERDDNDCWRVHLQHRVISSLLIMRLNQKMLTQSKCCIPTADIRLIQISRKLLPSQEMMTMTYGLQKKEQKFDYY